MGDSCMCTNGSIPCVEQELSSIVFCYQEESDVTLAEGFQLMINVAAGIDNLCVCVLPSAEDSACRRVMRD